MQAFGAIGRFADATILRADIDAGFRGQAVFTEDVPEFGGIIGGEEDVVPVHFEAAGFGRHHGDEGGKRAFVGFDAGDGPRRSGAEAAIGEGGNVAVGKDIVGGEFFTAGELHPGGAAVPYHDLGNVRVVMELRAQPLGEQRHLAGDFVHAAFHQPHAACFQMGDQHQRGSGLEWIGAGVGGIAAVKLVQARIAEIFAQCVP